MNVCLSLAQGDGSVEKVLCLSYWSIAVKRNHDQDNLQKKAFNWGLAYIFRGQIHGHPVGENGRQTGLVEGFCLIYRCEAAACQGQVLQMA